MQLRALPEGCTADDVKESVEKCGVTVRSIAMENDRLGKPVALVRFPPLPLPWTLSEEDLAMPLFAQAATHGSSDKAQEQQQGEEHGEDKQAADASEEQPAAQAADEAAKESAGGEAAAAGGEGVTPAAEGAGAASDHKPKTPQDKLAAMLAKTQKQEMLEDGRRDGDAQKMSRCIATHLVDQKIQIGGIAPSVDAAPQAVTLFLTNLTHETDEELRTDMQQYGGLERCFIMRSADGSSKVRRS